MSKSAIPWSPISLFQITEPKETKIVSVFYNGGKK